LPVSGFQKATQDYCLVNLKMTDKSVGQTFLSVVYLKRTNESGKNA